MAGISTEQGPDSEIVIEDLRQHFTTIATREAARAARRLQIGSEAEETLNQMAETIVARLLRAPEQQLSRPHLAAAAKQLFSL